jgi:hypothetical protein
VAPLCWWDVFLAGLGIVWWEERAIDATDGAALPPGTLGPIPKARNLSVVKQIFDFQSFGPGDG